MKFKFATAINCIDGRVQAPVTEFIRNNYDIDFVDSITVPGADKVLSECEDIDEVESIKKKALVSYKSHNSKLIFIVGHYDCAGNPCREADHLQHIRKSIQNAKTWNMNAEIYGIWVDKAQKAFLVQ